MKEERKKAIFYIMSKRSAGKRPKSSTQNASVAVQVLLQQQQQQQQQQQEQQQQQQHPHSPHDTAEQSTPPPPLTKLPQSGFIICPLTMAPVSLLKVPQGTLPLSWHPSATDLSSYMTMTPVTHLLYFKQHQASSSTHSKKRPAADHDNGISDEDLQHDQQLASMHLSPSHTLFLCNIPVDTSKNHLQRLFRRCGSINKAIIDHKRRQAHVVFEDSESVERAMAMRSRKRVWSDEVDLDGMAEMNDHEQQQDQNNTYFVGMRSKWVSHNHITLCRLAYYQHYFLFLDIY